LFPVHPAEPDVSVWQEGQIKEYKEDV